MRSYKQVKHLLFEHQNNITQLKADGENALAKQQEDRGRELEAKRSSARCGTTTRSWSWPTRT